MFVPPYCITCITDLVCRLLDSVHNEDCQGGGKKMTMNTLTEILEMCERSERMHNLTLAFHLHIFQVVPSRPSFAL